MRILRELLVAGGTLSDSRSVLAVIGLLRESRPTMLHWSWSSNSDLVSCLFRFIA